MKPVSAKRERGVVLLAMLAVIMLGASWLLLSQLNAESGGRAAVNKARNAEVLNRAKQALIGYVAAQAAKAFEDRPGALPCPEAAGYFDSTTQDGQAAGSCSLPKVGRFPWRTIGTDKLVDASGEPLWYVVSRGWAYTSGTGPVINSNSIGQLTVDGTATTPVASPGNVNLAGHGFAVDDTVSFTTGGTLPTGITAGTTYYVIAAGLTADAFRIATAQGGSAINFTGASSGTHNVHRSPPGAANSVVALIIAPGPAFAAPAATGCTAWPQVRPTTGTPDWRNYLECENADSPADSTFVSFRAPIVDPITKTVTQISNDQVIKITVADIMPGIEAAIADRIERQIAPALKSVYASSTWGATVSAANPVFPYPATFANPNPSTSPYQGSAALPAGLLPFFQTQGCTPATDPRCTTATTGGPPLPFLVFSKNAADVQASGSGTIRTQSSCTWQSQIYVCTGEYLSLPIQVTFQLRVTNIAMGLRTFDTSKITCTAVDDVGAGLPTQNIGCQSTGVALQSDGSAIVTVTTNSTPDIVLSGWGTYAQYKINFDRAVFGDHALLDLNDATTGWFVRNEWYRLLYYAVASGHTAAALPGTPGCTDGSTCLVARNPASNLTTLNGGIAGADTTLVVSSSSGAPATNFRIQVDSEVLRVTAVSGTTWTVVRGIEGSSATSHNDQSRVKLVGRDRAILILAGRSFNGSSRPSATLADYFEFGNTKGTYERQTVTPLSASMYVDTGSANAYVVAVASLATGANFQFRAANANTGNSTLNTTATGARSLVNSDGSDLAASTIQANAVLQVAWDGTQFLLSKRPFNDRIVAISSN